MCIPDVLDLVTKYLLIAVCHINGKDIQTTIPNTLMDFSLTSALPNDNQLRWVLVNYTEAYVYPF